MIRTLRLILTFYRSFFYTTFVLNVMGVSLMYSKGINSYTLLFWYKIITLGIIFYVINLYKKKEYYYYKNLGVSKFMIWIPILSFEFIVFNLLLFLTLEIRWKIYLKSMVWSWNLIQKGYCKMFILNVKREV